MKKLIYGMFAIALVMGAETAADVYQMLTGRNLVGTTSSQTDGTTLNRGTSVLRITAENDSFIATAATNPSATASSFFVPANTPVFLGVQGSHYIAYRVSATAGDIFIQEMSK